MQIFRPTPWPVINRMFSYPPSIFPLAFSLISLYVFPWSYVFQPLEHWGTMIFGLLAVSCIFIFCTAMFRYGFGSYASIEKKNLTISSIGIFGLGERKTEAIDLSQVKKIIWRKETQPFSRGNRFTFFFFVFEMKNGNKRTVSMRTWDQQNFHKLLTALQQKCPSLPFEEGGVRRKTRNISFA